MRFFCMESHVTQRKFQEIRIGAWGLRGVLTCVLLPGLLGCRRATEADCEFIVDRSVELELKRRSIQDPETIAKEREKQRGLSANEIKDCVGRWVTDGKMACIRNANTSEEMEKCLR